MLREGRLHSGTCCVEVNETFVGELLAAGDSGFRHAVGREPGARIA